MVAVLPSRFLAGFAAVLAAAACPRALPAAEDDADRALIGQYCLACHNDDLRTAGVSLQGADPADVTQRPALWEKALRKVASGEMPPAGMPAPDAASAAGFAARLEKALDAAAAAAPNPGRVPAHRLNRAEYSNAVRDLLALDLDAGDMLPADDSGYGFDNIADVLSLSPALLDRYMFAARRISRMAVGSVPEKAQKDIFVRNRETGFLHAGHGSASRQDLPIGADRGAALRYYFPLDGEYVISTALDQGDSRTAYESHELRLRVKAGMRVLALTFPGESSRPERARPAGAGGSKSAHPPLDVRLDGKRLRLIELPDAEKRFKIRWVAIDGPYNPTGPGDTPSRRKIFSCRPANAAEETPCAKRILSALARQAYRRPIDNADVSALLAIYEMGRAAGDFEQGIEKALRALLVAPGFLFRIEHDPPGIGPAAPYRISAIELASRLSFFLWSSLPDEELLQTAEDGRLREPETLAAQTRRMLADRRSRALVENFAGQWLELRNVAKVKPDEVLFPEFDGELRLAMQRETELFLENILKKNRSVLELLDADRTFLNERLAEHYGVEDVYGPQFREVRLRDARRGGLLGQGSILTVTSYPNRTSVVIRGKWILENLFGMPPPPPPPDIPELEEAGGGERLTLREMMSLHSKNPTCASCHARMDPIGFALENYDAIGRWRTEDAGTPIDASGELPGGIVFDGPAELKRVFATDFRETFVTTVVEKMLTYALGRGLEYYDKPTVRAIVREAERNEHRLEDLILGIVRSMPFQMRRSRE